MTDVNDWDATKRAVSDLCQALWTDPGHPCSPDLLNKIGEMRTAIHRSAEVTRQPQGAVITVHGDLDRAASAWSERGSGLHRQAQAETERATIEAGRQQQAAIDAAAAAAGVAARAAKGLPADWRTIEIKPGARTVIEAPWFEFSGSTLDAPGVLIWFDDDTDAAGRDTEAGEVVREVLDLRHAVAAAG